MIKMAFTYQWRKDGCSVNGNEATGQLSGKKSKVEAPPHFLQQKYSNESNI